MMGKREDDVVGRCHLLFPENKMYIPDATQGSQALVCCVFLFNRQVADSCWNGLRVAERPGDKGITGGDKNA